MRTLKYREALDEGLFQAMELDDSVFCMGIGVDDPKGIFGTTLGAYRKFGAHRVFDMPLSEGAITGIGIGAALAGMRPVIVHARNDFLLLTMDQMVNHAAKWRYMSGGKTKVPLTVRAIIGRGWGQAAQHSQSLQALFCHVPGLRVAMPSNPSDAKGLLMAAIASDFPTILIEHRLLFEEAGPVDEGPYETPLGKGSVVRRGADVTIVATSQMVGEAKKAAESLAGEGVEAEVLDPRWLSPLDDELILTSVEKTGRLVVADTGWTSGGVSAEIAARVAQKAFHALRAPIQRVALPDVPTPCSSVLERVYYPGSLEIAAAARRILGLSTPSEWRKGAGTPRGGEAFRGPF